MATPTKLMQVAKETCTLMHFEGDSLWYTVDWWTEQGDRATFEFPIPVSDAGGGKFLPIMPALHLMRWIRKHIDLMKCADCGKTDGHASDCFYHGPY